MFRRRVFYLIFKITPPPPHPFKCRVQIRESNWTVTLSMFSLNFKITPSLRSHSTLLTSVQIIGVVNRVGVVAFDVWSYGIRRPNIKPLGWLKFWQNLLYMSRTRCTRSFVTYRYDLIFFGLWWRTYVPKMK